MRTSAKSPVVGALFLVLAAPSLAASIAPAPAQAPQPAAGAAARRGAETRPSEVDVRFFEARVRPLLVRRCQACHSATLAQAGLRLDDGDALRHGGERGPVIVPGEPEESRFVQAVRYTNPQLQMPPTGKLPEAEIEILAEWVRRGAVWPAARKSGREDERKNGRRRTDGRASGSSTRLHVRGPQPATGSRAGAKSIRPHWAFAPLRPPKLPAVKNRSWVRTPVDAFVLARLERAGKAPAPPADQRTLIRRVYFDLIGLPPAPEEVEAFLTDSSADAYARVVDRLLASPHYGERWGRHWLDLVRYCDVPEQWAQTEAQAWLYRDWVVRALNEDLPYDRFVRLQLAADELPETPPADLAALGFLGLSPSYWKELKLAPDVIKTVVAEEWEERIHTVGSTLLGLTVACARCHDHKFDPISMQDYYALAGVFASTRLAPRPLLPAEQAKAVLAAREQVKELEAEAKRLQDAAARDAGKAAELKRQSEAALARAAELKRTTPRYGAPLAYAVDTASLDVLPDGPDRTKVAYREGVGQDVPLQVRGSPASPGPVVPRRFLGALSRGQPALLTAGSGRLGLADAIFRDAAPLAARVMANRVWKHHFGRGLVETPSNFGLQGDRPSDAGLLEYLATYLTRGSMDVWKCGRVGGENRPNRSLPRPYVHTSTRPHGQPRAARPWSLKSLHRLIVLSSAYQQRAAPRRLEVEAWRDAVLSAAGTLDLRVGGPPQALGAAENSRRTVYGTVVRRDLDDLLRLYDFPDPTTHSPARFHTTTPLQQLFVLNSPFIGRQAAALAARVRNEVPDDLAGQVRRAYALLYSRPPTERELAAARDFLASAADEDWQQYAEVLLARSELMFVE